MSLAYARFILGELSNCSSISCSASFATGDCTRFSTFDSFFVIPLYISSACFIKAAAISSFGFHARPLDSTYDHSFIPVIFSIFALSVGVNQRSLRTTATGIFLVTVSDHGTLIDVISLVILFFTHSTPHFISAVPYFPVLLAIAHIAGATTFSAIGHSTAPHIVPAISSLAVGSSPLSASVYAGVPVAPIIAPLPAVASHHPPFRSAPPAYHTGAVNAVVPPILYLSTCSGVRSSPDCPALVISAPIRFDHSWNVWLACLHFCAAPSAHTISRPHAMRGSVTYSLVALRILPVTLGICSPARKAPTA